MAYDLEYAPMWMLDSGDVGTGFFIGYGQKGSKKPTDDAWLCIISTGSGTTSDSLGR